MYHASNTRRGSDRTDTPVASLVPLPTWDNHASDEHSVQFYDDDDILLDELSRFVGAALGAGDASVVVATAAHRTGLMRRLWESGLDMTVAIAQGRYLALDAAETLAQFMQDGWPDRGCFADVIGGAIAHAAAAARCERPRVAIFGEMVALLWAEGQPEAALQLERLWNDLAQSHSFILRCAYPMRFFAQAQDSVSIERICSTHTQVIPAETYTALTTEDERLRAITLLQQKARALEAEIEEHKRVQQALEYREAELEQAVAARDEFLSVAAHELKTPITGARAVTQLLLRTLQRKREMTPERLESDLRTIEWQTTKLQKLVGRIFDAAHIQAGTLQIEPVQSDLVALVRAAIAQQEDADDILTFSGPAHLEARVDPARFERVIADLLENAMRFSPAGGKVWVELTRDEDGGIRLSVTDQGIGIVPEQRTSLFERFHQGDQGQHLSGMGLGLYITRQIVALHGGRVWFEQPEHRGARFVVALPAT